MRDEAAISINGVQLTGPQSRVVRVALAAFADILANQLGFKDDGIAITDLYQADAAFVIALIEGRASRSN